MSADPSLLSPPIALAQHKSALWADDGLHVYAVLMGSRIPDLPKRLDAAEVEDYDCLLPGALAPELRLSAPYLARLRRESPFTDWLLFEAAEGLGDWGLVVRSQAKLMMLRNHLRDLSKARIPGGHSIQLDWMDPEILAAVLPGFGGADLTAFFGPVKSLVVPGVKAWQHAELAATRLVQRSVPVAGAPA